MKLHNSHEYIRKLAKNISPELSFNGDFCGWQKRAKSKLTELLRLPLEKCGDDFKINSERDCGDYKRIDFEFQSEPGYYVSSSFLIPENAKKPCPTVICIQGHTSGMHVSLGEVTVEEDIKDIAGGRDFAVQALKECFCAVTVEQRYMGSAGNGKEGVPACLSENEAMAALLIGRCAIGERVWDMSCLIDVIFKHFSEFVDKEKLICLGSSGGGTTTFYTSCLDDRIKVSVVSGAMCSFDDSIMAMSHCPCNFVPNMRRYFDMGDLGGLIAPRKLVIVCGTEDPIFPLHGVEKSFKTISETYRAVGKENLCRLVKGNGGHRFYPDEAWPQIKELVEM